jgi:hypothetical protein
MEAFVGRAPAFAGRAEAFAFVCVFVWVETFADRLAARTERR